MTRVTPIHDVFMSYAQADRERVKPVADALAKHGWNIWWDQELKAGQQFHNVIDEALVDSACVLVVWTETSVRSRWVIAEADEGANRGILVPILLDEVKIPVAFRGMHTLNLKEWAGNTNAQILDTLLSDIGTVVCRAGTHSSPVLSALGSSTTKKKTYEPISGIEDLDGNSQSEDAKDIVDHPGGCDTSDLLEANELASEKSKGLRHSFIKKNILAFLCSIVLVSLVILANSLGLFPVVSNDFTAEKPDTYNITNAYISANNTLIDTIENAPFGMMSIRDAMILHNEAYEYFDSNYDTVLEETNGSDQRVFEEIFENIQIMNKMLTEDLNPIISAVNSGEYSQTDKQMLSRFLKKYQIMQLVLIELYEEL